MAGKRSGEVDWELLAFSTKVSYNKAKVALD